MALAWRCSHACRRSGGWGSSAPPFTLAPAPAPPPTRSGWKTREGRPRLGDSRPRHHGGGGGGGGGGRPRRGVVPAELAATRDLRAMVNWPGLLEMLEEEGVMSVPTDGVRYWLARLGAGFQVRRAAWRLGCDA